MIGVADIQELYRHNQWANDRAFEAASRLTLAEFTSAHQPLSENADCDSAVIRQAQDLDEHRGLQTHTEEPFWRANSLIAYALTCLGVARVARRLRFPSVLLQPLGHLSVWN